MQKQYSKKVFSFSVPYASEDEKLILEIKDICKENNLIFSKVVFNALLEYRKGETCPKVLRTASEEMTVVEE